MKTNISVGRADKGHLWLEYYISPPKGSDVYTIWVAEDDGFPFLQTLANLAEGEKIHPYSEDGVKICKLFAGLELLNEHSTFNGLQYSHVSEEAQAVVKHVAEQLYALRDNHITNEDVSLSANCGHWICAMGGPKFILHKDASKENTEDWLELVPFEQFTQEKAICFVVAKETICPPKCQPILM